MKCVGLLGRLFGHKIKNILILEKIPLSGNNNTYNNATEDIIKTIRKYKVVCVRCGLSNE